MRNIQLEDTDILFPEQLTRRMILSQFARFFYLIGLVTGTGRRRQTVN